MAQPKIKEVDEEDFFSKVFDVVTSDAYIGKAVQVSVHTNDKDSWKSVEEGLDSQIMLMKSLKFSQVKFTIISKETTYLQIPPPSNLPNAFEKLMTTEVKLPIRKEEKICLNLLYNEIILLLESKKVG